MYTNTSIQKYIIDAYYLQFYPSEMFCTKEQPR